MKQFLIGASLLAAAALLAQQKGAYQPKNEVLPGEGFAATYPKETLCMGCHQSIKTDSPEIQKLAKFAKAKEPVPWVRIYQVPDFVWFSHALHVKDAGIDCQQCHGEVAQRDVLFKEKSISMMSCMDCHARSQASNGCDVCHASQ